MPRWLLILTAIALGYAIWRIGIASIRSLAPDPDADVPPDVPEDVDDLDVYLVCGECGTEFKVSRLGELQVPRHCGERMQVVGGSADVRPTPEPRLRAPSLAAARAVHRGATAVHRLSTVGPLGAGAGSPLCGQPLWGITSV